MAIKIYWTPLSSPSRAVVMCATTLGIDFESIVVNLLAGEHMTPEYLKNNPQHTVPVLVDGDLVLTESRAMLQYLASAYGKDESFYPKCNKKRALVDQRLFFDASTLYTAFANAYYVIFQEKKLPVEAKIQRFDEVLGFLETYLSKTTFVAGDNFTIADFTVLATLTTAEVTGHSLAKFPKITNYVAKCKTLVKDYEENNGKGAIDFGNFVNSIRKDLTA